MKTYHTASIHCAVYQANNYDEINGILVPTYVSITFDPNSGTCNKLILTSRYPGQKAVVLRRT